MSTEVEKLKEKYIICQAEWEERRHRALSQGRMAIVDECNGVVNATNSFLHDLTHLLETHDGK